jgi:hypothetical protein
MAVVFMPPPATTAFCADAHGGGAMQLASQCWLRAEAVLRWNCYEAIFGSMPRRLAADVRADEKVHIAAPIKNSTVNPNIGAAAPFGALAVQFPYRAAAVLGTFFWSEKLALGHCLRLLAFCGSG